MRMFETLFGSGMPLSARFIIAFVIVLALIGLAAWLVRRFGAHRFGTAGTRGRQPRLAVIDASIIDGRRRLVLIRRDNIEHLLMIGGPTDVVIEANIIRATPARETSIQTTSPADSNWPIQPTVPRNYSRSESGMRAPVAPLAETANEQKNFVHNDHNLTEMALQLEASLRRKPKGGNQPLVRDSLTTHQSKLTEPAPQIPVRELKSSSESKTMPNMEPRFEPRLDIQPELEPEIKAHAASDLVANGQPSSEPLVASKPYYDSLEEEMANLLGRARKT
jgi:flagellar protein FliO/FliZ